MINIINYNKLMYFSTNNFLYKKDYLPYKNHIIFKLITGIMLFALKHTFLNKKKINKLFHDYD